MRNYNHIKNEGEFHILCLEDCDLDVELITDELRKNSFSFQVTQKWECDSFKKALESENIDLILSDSKLPKFNTLDALAFARSQYPQIPFVFVSGALLPSLKTEVLAMGAAAYVSKNNLSQLPPVLEHLGFHPVGPKKKIPPMGMPVIARCKEFRCLAYIDRDGTWRDFSRSTVLPEVIDWFEI